MVDIWVQQNQHARYLVITLGWGLCPFGGRDTQQRARGARTGNGMWGMRGKPREPRVMRREGGLEEQKKCDKSVVREGHTSQRGHLSSFPMSQIFGRYIWLFCTIKLVDKYLLGPERGRYLLDICKYLRYLDIWPFSNLALARAGDDLIRRCA